jgi:hypothetical protein
MLMLFITRSDVPVFLMTIGFSDVSPTLTLPRVREYEGVTDILGVCEWAGNAKAENRTNRLENRTNDFLFISFTPVVYVPERQGLGIHPVLKRSYQAISIPRERSLLKNLFTKIVMLY